MLSECAIKCLGRQKIVKKKIKIIVYILVIIISFFAGKLYEQVNTSFKVLFLYGFISNEKASQNNMIIIRSVLESYYNEKKEFPKDFDELIHYDLALGPYVTSPLERDKNIISYDLSFDPNNLTKMPIIYEKTHYNYSGKYHFITLPCGAIVLAETKDLLKLVGDKEKSDLILLKN